MDFTITVGWWILPTLITAIAFYIALREQPTPSGTDYGAGGVIGLMFVMAAAILSLVSWLVWAVFA